MISLLIKISWQYEIGVGKTSGFCKGAGLAYGGSITKVLYHKVMVKVGHLQPFYLLQTRLGCSLGGLQAGRPDKFCQAQNPEDKNIASISIDRIWNYS